MRRTTLHHLLKWIHVLQKNKNPKRAPTAGVNDQNCTLLIFCENVTRNDLGGKYQQLTCPEACSFRAELATHSLVCWYVENVSM